MANKNPLQKGIFRRQLSSRVEEPIQLEEKGDHEKDGKKGASKERESLLPMSERRPRDINKGKRNEILFHRHIKKKKKAICIRNTYV